MQNHLQAAFECSRCVRQKLP